MLIATVNGNGPPILGTTNATHHPAAVMLEPKGKPMSDLNSSQAITDRQKMLIAEGFRRLRDRIERAAEAEYDVAHDMLAKAIIDAKNLRKTLIRAKKD